MEVYRFRVLIDQAEHVFRDIDIACDATFLHLHEAIIASFHFSGREMASFYLSDDEWNKGDEIALMDMHDVGEDGIYTMDQSVLRELLDGKGSKMLYLYDFLRMWIFFVELIEVRSIQPDEQLPIVVLSVGKSPNEYDKAMVDGFGTSAALGDDDFDDDLDEYSEDFDTQDFEGYEEDPFH